MESDPVHSEIQFKVRHLMITTVTGYFREFNLEVETEGDDFTKASKILFTADINSISTNNAQRDTHLKSPDFFAADQYQESKFEGSVLGSMAPIISCMEILPYATLQDP
jgi:polyisoprenoid-binding protein YceI